MDHLDRLSQSLFDEATTHVLGARAGTNPTWLWSDIVKAQTETVNGRTQPTASYRMPAPVIGWVPHPTVLVIGQNPNVALAEVLYPRLDQSWTLARYTAFFREYFNYRKDGRPGDRYADWTPLNPSMRKLKHFGYVEDVLCPTLGPCALGRNALYADALPWATQWLDGRLLTDGVVAYAKQRVAALVRDLKPKALLGLGWAPTNILFGRASHDTQLTFCGVPFVRVIAPNGIRFKGKKADEIQRVTDFLSLYDTAPPSAASDTTAPANLL